MGWKSLLGKLLFLLLLLMMCIYHQVEAFVKLFSPSLITNPVDTLKTFVSEFRM